MKNLSADLGISTTTPAPEQGSSGQGILLKGGRNVWCSPMLHRLNIDQTANGVASGNDGVVSTT